MKFFLLFYFLVYLYFVLKNFFVFCKIRKVTNILGNYLNSVTINKYYSDDLIKKDNYQKCLDDVLFYYPTISEFADIYEPLQYGVSDIQNLISANKLYNNLLMNSNFIAHSFIKSLNPIYALKQIIKIPSSFITWIGFNPSSMFSKLFNILCWLLAFALNMYSEEIKTFISTLIHK